jgi:hypothetical protein
MVCVLWERASAATAAEGARRRTRDAAAATRGRGVLDGRREVGDVLGNRVLGPNGTGVNAVALAGLGHGVVARVEVLAVLEMLGEVVGTRGELAVEAEEALLLRGEGLYWRVR